MFHETKRPTLFSTNGADGAPWAGSGIIPTDTRSLHDAGIPPHLGLSAKPCWEGDLHASIRWFVAHRRKASRSSTCLHTRQHLHVALQCLCVAVTGAGVGKLGKHMNQQPPTLSSTTCLPLPLWPTRLRTLNRRKPRPNNFDLCEICKWLETHSI